MSISDLPKVDFFGLEFYADSSLFVPYKEAEFLVELVLQLNPTTILDIGTGIGNIAITLVKNIPDAKAIGIDLSQTELELGRLNAKKHLVEDRVEFKQSDLLQNINYSSEVFVSNLPFLPSERAKLLSNTNEPSYFLDGGRDGFDLYRKLFVQMINKNIYPHYLIAEIDYSQIILSITEVSKFFPKCKAEILRDHKRKVTALMITL